MFWEVKEISDAKKIAGELFFNAFRCNIPDEPYHFVLLFNTQNGIETGGYVHFQRYKEREYLCGGLVVNANLFRRLLPEQRTVIKSMGGFAEILLKESFSKIKKWDVIWGYVGDKLAEKVDLRVGFRHTQREYIMAVWGKEFSELEKYDLIEQVYKVGPF